jgi:hypothetical protein
MVSPQPGGLGQSAGPNIGASPTMVLGFGTCLPATPQFKRTETKVDDFSDSIRLAIAPGDRTIPKRCMKYSLVVVV